MRKPKKPRKATVEQLAEVSRNQAALDPPTVGPVTVGLDPQFAEIKATASIPEIIEAMKAQKKTKRSKGRPVAAKTPYWIRRFAEQKRRGLPYSRLIQEFRRPNESLARASMRLRKFCSTYRAEIGRELIR
jgi:hypothetical protein